MRNIDKSVPAHRGSVRNRREDILTNKSGVLAQKLVETHSRREKIQNERNPNTGTPNTRLAETNIRID